MFSEKKPNVATFPKPKFEPLKTKLVRPDDQAKIDSYRKIKSLMP